MVDDFLTDENIEALLSSLNIQDDNNKEKTVNKKVQTYDFRKAIRFSQDQIRTITRLKENLARLLASYFSTQLRTYVQVTVESVEQYPYDEFLTKVHTNAVFGVFKAPPLQGNMVLSYSNDLLHLMLDRLFGGQGSDSNLPAHNDFTEIELSVIRREFLKTLDFFQEAWSKILEVTPDLTEIEMNPQFLAVTVPNETVVLTTLIMRIGDKEGKITFCLPHLVLEPFLQKLTARHWLASQNKNTDQTNLKAIENLLKETKLDVNVILGESKISIGDFLTLSKGDIIRLDQFYEDPLMVMVDKKPKFYAQPGLAKGRMAVQVTHIYRESDETNEQ